MALRHQLGLYIEGSLDERRDGCRHLSKLDDCDCSSPAFDRTLSQTAQATFELFEAVLDGVFNR